MKSWTLAIVLIGLGWASQAQAGLGLFKHRGASAATIPGTTTAYPVGSTSPDSAATTTPPMKPYSYFAAAPGTARGYYGYGEDQFPYNGRAYGHPYDPWTWPYMSNSYNDSLHRYYAPVLK